jgi:hypothetical protein
MEAKLDKIIEILRHRKHDPEIAGPVLRKKRGSLACLAGRESHWGHRPGRSDGSLGVVAGPGEARSRPVP